MPTGSGSAAMSSRPRAIASTRAGVERQPVDEGARRAARPGVGDVLRVGRENFGGAQAQRGAPRPFSAALRASVGDSASLARGGARGSPQRKHLAFDVGACRAQRRFGRRFPSGSG